MNAFSQEIFYASIVLFIATLIYLRTQKQITASIYKYIGYILLSSVAIFFALFSIAYWLANSDSSYLFFILIFIYAIICFTSIIYILKKYFQCTTWFPRLLFALFTLSLYYIPTLLWLFLAVVVFDLH